MRSDYDNDAEPNESYPEYLERKKAEESNNGVVIAFFTFIFNALRALVVYSPLFYVGYILAKKINLTDQTSFYMLIILLAYLLYSLIFFIKGMLIGLKQKRNVFWILLWVLCVIATCLIPALIAEEFFEQFFKPDTRMLFKNQLVAWIFGLLFGLYVYHRYKFKTASAPRIVWWSYSLGFGLI